MLPFNKPYFVGTETRYIEEAVRSGKISGDGMFTRRCEAWFAQHLGTARALLTTSCTDALELAVQDVEAEVFSDERSNPVERIYRLKRQVLDLLRNISPLSTAVEPMAQSRLPHSHPELADYFRDVADHLKRVLGRVDTTREVLTDVLNANPTASRLAWVN